MPAPGACALLQGAWKGTSKNPNPLPGGTCSPDRALHIPWERTHGICPLAQAARDHPCSHGDANPQPRQGCSPASTGSMGPRCLWLRTFFKSADVSGHPIRWLTSKNHWKWHDMVTIFRLPPGVLWCHPAKLQCKWDLLLSVSRQDDTFRDADVMRIKWWKRERKAGLCEGRSFLFPEVVHSLPPLRFPSENLTRIDSADSSLSWKQDGGEIHWNVRFTEMWGSLKSESSEKLHSWDVFTKLTWPRSNGQPLLAPSIHLFVSNGRPFRPIVVPVLVRRTHHSLVRQKQMFPLVPQVQALLHSVCPPPLLA